MRHRITKLIFLGLFVSVSSFAYTLSSLIASAGTAAGQIIVDDKIFYDFGWAPTFPTPGQGITVTGGSADDIDVTGIHTILGSPGLDFHSILAVTNTSATAVTFDAVLSYRVKTIDGSFLIHDIEQYITPGFPGNPNAGGSVSLAETAMGVDNTGVLQTANSTVGLTVLGGDLTDPPGELTDDLVFAAPLALASVTKDIRLTANAGAEVDLTDFKQGISELPEPGFYGALSLGLAGLMLIKRHRSTAR